jgi:uncharacterized protein (DUF924 family)
MKNRNKISPSASKIVDFWTTIGPAGWFKKDEEVDRTIAEKFSAVHEMAMARKLDSWLDEPLSGLALVLLLDQFSRNMFRGDARSFAGDRLAVDAATNAISKGYHLEVEKQLAVFFFMPFMHSESISEQNRCVELMHRFGTGDYVKYAILHRDIIVRFARFPHRNPVLGRHTTPAERAYLDAGGFAA